VLAVREVGAGLPSVYGGRGDADVAGDFAESEPMREAQTLGLAARDPAAYLSQYD